MEPKDFVNIDTEKFTKDDSSVVNSHQERVTESIVAHAEYQAAKDDCLFEARNALRQMQEDSKNESKYQHRINNILITLGVLTLIATVAPIIISLLL